MDFYSLWKETRTMGFDDAEMIHAFLRFEAQTIDPFVNGDESSLETAYALLDSISIDAFFDAIKCGDYNHKISPAMVPCFSNFENGAHRLIELLEFEPDGLSFAEAGFQLIEAVSEGAKVKYGENQSKLARIMSLVSISSNKPAVVTTTPWGNYLVRFNMEQKQGVLKKLLLRDPCIQSIIHSALNDYTRYADKVAALSKSTAIRRRTNVKWLIEYILSGTDNEAVMLHIDWEV